MGALIGLPGDPGPTGYTLAPDGPAEAGETVNVLVSRHRGLPRDRMGNRLSASGRSLITEALHRTYGRRITAADLARDGLKRWSVPALGLSVSVAHVAAYSAVAFAPAGRVIGVDLQDERDRPHALRWLGDLLGREEPATIRDFAECEALIKASHLTKETFAGIRLPPWRPGWRPVNCETYEVRSVVLRAEGEAPLHLALACDAPAPVRFHHLEEE
ncbi:hypothetical protein [Streptomyces sp. NPDC013181]|uniref:hypothetical protein n=1 Tax=Streptomyces sp. NPDC013181 TaxID=3364864 RepID=UPI0036904901